MYQACISTISQSSEKLIPANLYLHLYSIATSPFILTFLPLVHPYYPISSLLFAFLTKSKVSFITSTTLIRESRICLQFTLWKLVHHSNFNKLALKAIFIKEVRIISPRQEYIKRVSDLQLLKSTDFSSISSMTSPLIILFHISSYAFFFQPVCRIPIPFFLIFNITPTRIETMLLFQSA